MIVALAVFVRVGVFAAGADSATVVQDANMTSNVEKIIADRVFFMNWLGNPIGAGPRTLQLPNLITAMLSGYPLRAHFAPGVATETPDLRQNLEIA